MNRLLLSVFVFSILSLTACNSCEAKGVKSKRKLAKRVKVDRTRGETVVNDSVMAVADDNITPKDIPHEGFVYVKDYIPDIIEDLRYNTTNNFMGERADGYEANRAILTVEAAKALKGAAEELRRKGYVIKIYDAYRPQQAVDHFVRWSQSSDERMKAEYYPTLTKKSLFGGYIARKSGHSRGSTIDMTICHLATGQEVDMGGHFAFFGTASHPSFVGKYPLGTVTAENKKMRLMLQHVMRKHGFNSIKNEWWHFTLRNEPYPRKFFNFPVK